MKRNPIINPDPMPYNTPDFTAINEDDFLPAFHLGMDLQRREIEDIASQKNPPTIENTLDALESSGQLLNRTSNIFFSLTYANTNDRLQKIEEEIAPALAAQRDFLFMHEALFERIKYLDSHLDKNSLSHEQARLLAFYLQKFKMNGADLSGSDKATLNEINKREAALSTKFNSVLIAASTDAAVVVKDSNALQGLSAAASEALKDGDHWKINIVNTTQQPLLAQLENPALRRQILNASMQRCEHGDAQDTQAIILELAALRAQKAKLLGFNSYAAWNLQDQMVQNPVDVIDFLKKLAVPTTQRGRQEAAQLQSLATSNGFPGRISASDWNYYAEIWRQAHYDLDENQLKQYFVLENVLHKGVFYAAQRLFGLDFKSRTDLPVYHPDVSVYEVFDENGKPFGLFYFDPFKRDNKSGGAWMENICVQSHLLRQQPVIYNVCNFSKPTDGQPALLSLDDVLTIFHEFGHALHGFFADQQYPSLSGTAVARDFVELPSQFFEYWALHPEVLAHYATHYKTGGGIPSDLVLKIKSAQNFNQGYALGELLASSLLDMEWHSLTPETVPADVPAFEKEVLSRYGLYNPLIPPRYKSSYFQHIWGNGYAAGYYAYQWTEMLKYDVIDWFERHGNLTRTNGERYRRMILSRGNTEDYENMFEAFVGHAPRLDPLLKNRGLSD